MSIAKSTDLRSRSRKYCMQIPNDHSYTPHKNKQLLWIDSDSKEAFDRNMQDVDRCRQLEKYGWHKPGAITYQFNSHGFRCQEFDQSLGVITLGCSFTAGVGLPITDVWPTLVAADLGLPVWNLGVGGASMDTCFRLLYHYIHQLNSEYVLLLTPPDHRFELHTPSGVRCFNPQTIDHPIQKWWYQCTSNGELNYIKNIMAIAEVCRQHGRRLIVQTPETALFVLPHRDRWPTARDMLHVGLDEQKKCARVFLQAIRTDQANRETERAGYHLPQTD